MRGRLIRNWFRPNASQDREGKYESVLIVSWLRILFKYMLCTLCTSATISRGCKHLRARLPAKPMNNNGTTRRAQA